MNKENLLKRKEELKKELEEIELKISEDKDEIKKFLYNVESDDLKDIIANKIRRIRSYSGMTYDSFVWEMQNGKIYKILRGYNLCNSFLCFGEIDNYNDNQTDNLDDIEEKLYQLLNFYTEWDEIFLKLLEDQSDFNFGLIIGLACFDFDY